MGFTQGAQLKQKIHSAIESCSQQEAFRLEQPWWLPDTAYTWLAEQKALRLLSVPLPRDNPTMHERLTGLAQGAGLRLKTVYLMNAIEPLMSSVRDRCVVPSLAACSAIAVRGGRSVTGEPLIARNFDYLPFVQPYFTLRDNRPYRRKRSLEFTVATMAGAVDGMNEAGLSITYNYAYTVDEGPPSAPISMLITEALERCSSVAEAADWIASRPRWGGGILMLADPSGDIASMEISSTRSRVRRPEAGEDLLFHTNAFATVAMRDVEVPATAVFTDRAHPAVRGRRVLESADRRARRLHELLRHRSQLGPDELADVLADHGPAAVPNETTVCVHGSFRSTAASLQFLPRSRRVRVAYSSACRARFEEFAL